MELILFIISFLFVFGLVVLIHELGHFVAAKRAGLSVIEFGFGYPPRAFGKKIGGTIYSINWIPFGGFVKILGEDGSGENDPKSLSSQKRLVKAKVMVAGVLMNFILCVLILMVLYAVGFYPLIPGMEDHLGVEKRVYVENVYSDTPAFYAGARAQDKIISVNGEEISESVRLTELIKENIGKDTVFVIEREREESSFTVIPYEEEIDSGKIGRIGIAISEETKAENIFWAPVAGLSETLRLSYLTVVSIGQFFGKFFTEFKVQEGAVGPVGIAVISNEVRKLGFSFLMQFVAIISISLALLNLMPIPALDGGHLFIMAIEKIRGKEISAKLKNSVTLIGFSLLILIMIFITTQDIVRFNLIEPVKNLFGF